MRLSDFDYEFPRELIAQFPSPRRDSSRLMVLKRATGEIEDKSFSQIGEYLGKGDVLVLNDTRVIPARLVGRKEPTGGKVELLLLQRLDRNRWKALVKPTRSSKVGAKISFDHGGLKADITSYSRSAEREVTFSFDGDFMDILGSFGTIPLPPYIKRPPVSSDAKRYQTVYARKNGAIAAPTAGLHFTEDLLGGLQAKGVKIVYLTLHINYATFRTVVENDITKHKMHSEYFELPHKAANVINQTKGRGRVVAVGTSTCRVLEHVANEVHSQESTVHSKGVVIPMKGWTNLLIYPPYQFKVVDALITNFHLPRTTLLMLTSAFCGRKLLFDAYRQAIERRYRFFSYGDAMLII